MERVGHISQNVALTLFRPNWHTIAIPIKLNREGRKPRCQQRGKN
jgi:hypothetical protein